MASGVSMVEGQIIISKDKPTARVITVYDDNFKECNNGGSL